MRYIIILLIVSLSLIGCSQPSSVNINENSTNKTIIKTISRNTQYSNNSYMIISKSGTVIIVDPAAPAKG